MPERLLPAWEAFHAQAERVEAARRALLSCLPVGRVDPAPVPVGLELLRDELTDVAGQLHRWRTEEVDDTWRGCREAVVESLRAVDDAHRIATSTTELEELLDAVGDVVEPLDAWADAERRWLRLRR
ncbi:hypothetical protein BH20ACT9_BH20ACT9_17030 [soil metagenome]